MELTIKLNNGVKMPQLGVGTFLLGDDGHTAVVKQALAAGYRSFDTAAYYGTESAVGIGIKESGIPRQDVFITSKLWLQDAGYESTKRAFRRTCNRLGTDYLDLYLIHMPIGHWQDSWRAMQELYQAGKIRAIGVANFNQSQLATLLAMPGPQPMVDQIELHPFCQQHPLRKYLKKHRIAAEAWAPFARGKNQLFANPVLTKIANRNQVSVAQVILRWLRDYHLITIPKTTHEQRMRQNRELDGIILTNDDRQLIANLDTGHPLLLDLSKQSEIDRLRGLPFEE